MQIHTKLIICVLVFWGLALEARAQSPPVAPPPRDFADFAELGESLPDEGLVSQDGRQDTQIGQLNMQMSEMQNSATLSGNNLSAVNSSITTGLNSIGAGAFANATGIVTVIQNSGNQVLIQNDMILNLWVK